MDHDAPTRPVKTVQTAFEIVLTLRDLTEATVTELASELDLAKSTVHRHLMTLTEQGWVVRDGAQYRVGLRFLDVGIATRNANPIYRYTCDRVADLAEKTGEKAWCIVEQNGRGVHLYGESGTSPVQTYARPGQLTYLHQHAAGKSILANRPREEVERIIEVHGLPEITDQTITDPDELFEELEKTRRRGVAFNEEESVVGLNAVGAAITDQSGYALGAISISAPVARLQPEEMESDIAELLIETVNEIEINMEYAGGQDEYPLE
ncbi:IclR family transcriptional regulator [Natrarchaeobius chitinivorans]|uniref:IclR family transcriptional regulator n=1 Tax=Natrarchaeobius chitinivorans TaxID=1679083 RepID=A0A3N6MJ65_NATCH|nr:IclR family transcriptional regulator [Natrarchaeobius chitinivorans]RQG94166.1 IclR family transcriptional regulator [Natrarchaeobius chitinivorans]